MRERLTTKRRRPGSVATALPAGKRVAIYTRQSVDRSTHSTFGSLDAQREAIEAYVKSQVHEGWVAIPEVYADGGYSGASTDRPAFKRLTEDIEAGRIDVVAVYKIDRLSRSLLDFSTIIRRFEDHGVEFVSITQQFNTGSSMGKLTLNILMSFAEFEREVISERTRDKMAASRKRGLWVGGHSPLGYRSDKGKLIVVEDEAKRVRQIFKLYLQLGALSETCTELNRRGWTTKKGAAWGKSNLSSHLKQVLYLGKIPYKGATFDGQHDAIIELSVFDAVAAQLKRHRRGGGSSAKNKWAMRLKGILVCGKCGTQMLHTYSRHNERLYHYYVCPSLQMPGDDRCDGYRVSAQQIEEFVVDRIKGVGKDPKVLTATLATARKEAERERPELLSEKRSIQGTLRRQTQDRAGLLSALPQAGKAAPSIMNKIAETDDSIEVLQERRQELERRLIALETSAVTEDEVAMALRGFEVVWRELLPREQQRLLRLLIEKVRFEAGVGEVEISYRAGGIKALLEGAAV